MKLLLIGVIAGLVIGVGVATFYSSLAYFLRSAQEGPTLLPKIRE